MRKTRWKSSMVMIGLGLYCVDCQCKPRDLQPVAFNHIPPAVQSAFLAYYSPASIEKIEKEQQGDQDYYTFIFVDKDNNSHEVQLNEGGDQIQQR